MRILDICDPDIASVPVTATVKDSIETMLRMHVGAVAVVDAERLVAGIFTERDVLRKVALSGRDPASIPVREVMTSPVELATTATNPGEAMASGRAPSCRRTRGRAAAASHQSSSRTTDGSAT